MSFVIVYKFDNKEQYAAGMESVTEANKILENSAKIDGDNLMLDLNYFQPEEVFLFGRNFQRNLFTIYENAKP